MYEVVMIGSTERNGASMTAVKVVCAIVTPPPKAPANSVDINRPRSLSPRTDLLFSIFMPSLLEDRFRRVCPPRPRHAHHGLDGSGSSVRERYQGVEQYRRARDQV